MKIQDEWPCAPTTSVVDICTMRTESRNSEGERGGSVHLSSEVLLSMVLDRTTDGVLLSDAEGVVLYANGPLLEMFGYDAEDLMGQPVELLVPEYLRDQHRHDVVKYHVSPGPRPMGRDDLDLEGRRADGSCFSIDVQLDALPGSSVMVATVRDMTAQRRASVDRAIGKIDLANARTQIDRLQHSLDLVIQRLFALGTSIAASAANEPMLSERLSAAVQGIDQVIDTVQQCRQAVGP